MLGVRPATAASVTAVLSRTSRRLRTAFSLSARVRAGRFPMALRLGRPDCTWTRAASSGCGCERPGSALDGKTAEAPPRLTRTQGQDGAARSTDHENARLQRGGGAAPQPPMRCLRCGTLHLPVPAERGRVRRSGAPGRPRDPPGARHRRGQAADDGAGVQQARVHDERSRSSASADARSARSSAGHVGSAGRLRIPSATSRRGRDLGRDDRSPVRRLPADHRGGRRHRPAGGRQPERHCARRRGDGSIRRQPPGRQPDADRHRSGHACPPGWREAHRDFSTASDQVFLRAERSGTGDGRVYTVAFTAADGNGGACSGRVAVGVPHDKGGRATPVDSGLTVNSFGSIDRMR